MNSVFDDEIFLQATFTFLLASEVIGRNDRGLSVAIATPEVVTFYLRSLNGRRDMELRKGDKYVEQYQARVLSGNLTLPVSICCGSSGEGEVRGRKAIATVESISVSSVAPVIDEILGEKVILSIIYRGNNAVRFRG